MERNKIILDLCGGTGSWSRPYQEAGYDVRLITLPEYDVLRYKPPNTVYGILAAPPCTMFSIARRNAKTPPDFTSAMQVVQACLEIIWHCRAQGGLKFWALENPRGLLRQFLGKPAYSFQQWEYGAKLSKHTDLWGYFTIPTKTCRNRPEINIDEEWAHPQAPEWLKDKQLTRTEIRAITPEGFAKAFFKANR